MTEQPRPMSPLRQRMLDDIRMRKHSPKTQIGYVRTVKRFAQYLKRSPDTATAKDLRQFQLYSLDHGMSAITLNVTITGLKFLFEVTLGHPELVAKMQPVAVLRRLPPADRCRNAPDPHRSIWFLGILKPVRAQPRHTAGVALRYDSEPAEGSTDARR